MTGSNRTGLVIGLAAVLVGCQTAEQLADEQTGRIRAFHGRTMAAFISETGLVPSSAYPVASGRVFVVDGPPVVTSYGGYSSATACRLLVETEPNGQGSTADGWTIIGTSRSGPCHSLPI